MLEPNEKFTGSGKVEKHFGGNFAVFLSPYPGI
jgi:hypothetical protein